MRIINATTLLSLAIPSATRFMISGNMHSKNHVLRNECNAKDLLVTNLVDMTVSAASHKFLAKLIKKTNRTGTLEDPQRFVNIFASRVLGIMSSAVVHYLLFPKQPLSPFYSIVLNTSSLAVNLLGMGTAEFLFPETIILRNALLV